MTPEHYNKSIQPIEFMKATLSLEEYRGFLKGNIIKYISRAEEKGGKEDYEKAMVYLKWLIESYASQIQPAANTVPGRQKVAQKIDRCGEHWGEQNGSTA